jgi:polyhydroxyalkanoate depolymerase
MLYETYQWHDDLMAPMRHLARSLGNGHTRSWPVSEATQRHMAAGIEMLANFELTHERPDFSIATVPVGNREVPVTEEVVVDLPFWKLLHFVKDVDTPQPRVLVVAPLSGHFATLLRDTVATLLRDHDVYITDWVNARDVPADAGRFGVDEHIDYLIRYLEAIGPGGHVLAVCQPCVQTLAAVAVMSQDRNPATPRSMTLMAGPIDTRESPTAVNRLASEHPLSWFERNVIARVPRRYPGAGRRVYPGFLQLTAFMSMNMRRHRDMHRKLYRLLAQGEQVESKKIRDFYVEYFAVLDLTEEFYLETIDPSSSAPSWRKAPSPTAAARSIPGRSATPRC